MKTLLELWGSDPKVTFIISIISIILSIIGVGGVVLTICSYISQKKNEKAYEEILNAAKRENQFRMTKAQIQQQEVYAQELKSQIMTEIPKYAKISVLKAKAERMEGELTKEYQEYLLIKKELSTLEDCVSETELDDALSNLLREKKFRLDTKKGLWIIIAAFIFVPVIEESVFLFLHRVIFMTGAHISIQLLMTYLCLLIAATVIVFNKYRKKISNSKPLSLLIKSMIAIVAWFFTFYLPLYDIVKSLLIQMFLSGCSIIFFAFGINFIFILLFKLIYLKRVKGVDITTRF